MKIKTLTLCFLLTSFAYSQKADLSSPYKTIENHLKYLQDETYRPSISAKSFFETDKDEEEIADKLKKVLDAYALYVIMDKVPDNPNYIDSVSGEKKYILFDSHPKIYVKKYGDQWLYSEESVIRVNQLYAKLKSENLDSFLDNLPAFMFKKVLNIRIWKLAGIFLYLFLAFFIYLILNKIFFQLLLAYLKKIKYAVVLEKYLRPIINPFSLLIVIWILQSLLPYLRLPIQFSSSYQVVINFLSPLIITVIAYRSTEIISGIFSKIAEKTASTIDDQLVPLVRKALKLIVVVLGVIYIIHSLDINVTPLLAGASIGGLALALAAQDMLKNIFGSITIFTDRPFEVGDWIVFGNEEGVVEEVGIRSTRVRTFYNSLVSVPNGKIADMVVDNMGRRKYRRYRTIIGITYDTPADLIETYVEGIKGIIAQHPTTHKENYELHLNDFNSSSLDILVYIFFDVPNWTEELKSRQDFILECIRLANHLGVRFAFPTQTIHIEEIPGQDSLTPKYEQDREDFKNKLNHYLEKKEGK